VRKEFWLDTLKENHSEGLGEDNIKMDITIIEFWVWIEFIWLRRRTDGLSFEYGNQF
jgi:hypothetical protein